MKKPEIVNIEEGQWVCVAKDITKLCLHRLSSVQHAPQYHWTYRPSDITDEPISFGESIPWDAPTLPLLDFTAKVRVYIWAQNFDGKIRVDIYE